MIRQSLIIICFFAFAMPALAQNAPSKGHGNKCGENRGEWFTKLDSNGDGVLTASEAPRLVKMADANGDGQVTRDEIKAIFTEHAKDRASGKRHKCGGRWGKHKSWKGKK